MYCKKTIKAVIISRKGFLGGFYPGFRKGELMKRRVLILIAVLFVVSIMTAAACGMKEEGLKCTVNSNKVMSFEAVNASEGEMVLAGTLEALEGEEVEITPDLKTGALKLEFEGADSLITAYVSGTGKQTYVLRAGSYTVRATVTEKAKGTVTAVIKLNGIVEADKIIEAK